MILLLAATVWHYAFVSGDLKGVLNRYQSSTGGVLLLAPFKVFVHIFLSQSIFPDLVVWGTLGLAMNACLVAVIILLDQYLGEAVIDASLELHKRWDRALHGGLPWGTHLRIARSSRQPPIFSGISPFLVPFNVLLYEIENLFFLLFPAPLVPVGRADYDFIGRTLAGCAITVTVLIGSCFLAAGAGYAAATATDLSWTAFVIVAWIFLALLASMTLPFLSWAFNRFVVSRW